MYRTPRIFVQRTGEKELSCSCYVANSDPERHGFASFMQKIALGAKINNEDLPVHWI